MSRKLIDGPVAYIVWVALLLAACAGDPDPSFAIGHSFPEGAAFTTVEWYPESENLRVWFAPNSAEAGRSPGEPYLYCDVPRAVFEELVAAPSPGRYFHEHIAERYDTARFVADAMARETAPGAVGYWTCER